MALKLYSHPLASFCHKVLIALYESGTAFTTVLVNLGDPQSRSDFIAVWPTGKMPVLRDEANNRTVAESSIIIEYLEQHYPGAHALLPRHPEAALEARLWDRLSDHYVMEPMQTLVAQTLRPEEQRDAQTISSAKATLDMAYTLLESALGNRAWLAGETFSMADCAAAPALFYANIVQPFPTTHRHLAAYFERLMARPSVARVLKEARPYFEFFPLKHAIASRFLRD